MKGKPMKYLYQTHLRWTGEKKGKLCSKTKPDIEVACPPEFGGHPGIWSPEDLFLASVEICIMTTFLWYVNKENLSLKSYDSKASGTVEMSGGVFQFSSIVIKVRIGISSEDDRFHVEKMMKKVERACLITNSIRTDVNIESDVSIV